VYWKSSDTSVATVDSLGNVTGVGAGSATITAWVESKTATCAVTVGTTGISNNSKSVSKIYPNPVTGNSFTVDLSSFQSKVVNLSVFDICGKSIYKTQALNSIQLSRSQFNKGVYFVKLDDSSRTETIKMIVQ
jgi:alpha-amylase